MQLTFQYSPQLLQKAHELHFRKFFPFQGRLPLILGVLAIWAGLLLLLILGKEGNKLISVSLLVFGVLSIGLYYWMMKTLGKRVYKKLKTYHDPMMIDVGKEKIDLTIKDVTYEMPWADIKKAVVTADIILLYPTERMFYIFPEKNFQPGDFPEFEKLVREKAGKVY